MPRPRVLLGDDHAIVLEGLRRILEPDLDIVGTVENGRALVAAAGEFRPDLIVTDISMPLLNGIEATEQIKKVLPRTKVIFLTMHLDVAYATQAVEAGASGYVLKHSVSTELLTALQEVLKGGMYISPRIAAEVNEALASRTRRRGVAVKLTPRQREVLQLVAEGRTFDEIARILHISPRTVQFHKYGMMNALGVRRSAELIQYAIKHRIVSV